MILYDSIDDQFRTITTDSVTDWTVLDEFQTSSIEPAPHHGDDKLYLAAESSAELNCAPPDGLPAPTVWWQGPHGRRLTTPAHYTGSAILTLTRIRPQDSGVYTCHAKNIAQHHSTAVNILVTSNEKNITVIYWDATRSG